MKVKELIAILQRYNPDLDVLNYTCGDCLYTCPTLVEVTPIYHSGNSITGDMQILLYDEDSDNDIVLDRVRQLGFIEINM